MSEKRYGARPEEGFAGWTIEQLTDHEYTKWTAHDRCHKDLARDLLAAQARIAELDRELAIRRVDSDAYRVLFPAANIARPLPNPPDSPDSSST